MHQESLTAFLAGADHLPFGRAAAAEYVVVSTLSRRLSALERAAGLVLVDRTPGSVCLTEKGRAFLPIARRLLEDMRRADAAARGIAGARSQAPRWPTSGDSGASNG